MKTHMKRLMFILLAAAFIMAAGCSKKTSVLPDETKVIEGDSTKSSEKSSDEKTSADESASNKESSKSDALTTSNTDESGTKEPGTKEDESSSFIDPSSLATTVMPSMPSSSSVPKMTSAKVNKTTSNATANTTAKATTKAPAKTTAKATTKATSPIVMTNSVGGKYEQSPLNPDWAYKEGHPEYIHIFKTVLAPGKEIKSSYKEELKVLPSFYKYVPALNFIYDIDEYDNHDGKMWKRGVFYSVDMEFSMNTSTNFISLSNIDYGTSNVYILDINGKKCNPTAADFVTSPDKYAMFIDTPKGRIAVNNDRLAFIKYWAQWQKDCEKLTYTLRDGSKYTCYNWFVAPYGEDFNNRKGQYYWAVMCLPSETTYDTNVFYESRESFSDYVARRAYWGFAETPTTDLFKANYSLTSPVSPLLCCGLFDETEYLSEKRRLREEADMKRTGTFYKDDVKIEKPVSGEVAKHKEYWGGYDHSSVWCCDYTKQGYRPAAMYSGNMQVPFS